MLSMQRDLYRYETLMKRDRRWSKSQCYAHELYHKRIGIVSASMVGRRVIGLLKPFHCDIAVYDPYLSDAEASALGVRRVELMALFAESDIVSVHAPATPETRELIGPAHSGRCGMVLCSSTRRAMDRGSGRYEGRAGVRTHPRRAGRF